MDIDLGGKTVLVTGGTGSFGQNLIQYLLINHPELREIRVLSRDENKQDLMRKSFSDEKIKFYLGDVREKDSVNLSVKGSNFVFHAAALKQVPSCEFFPEEAVKTNVIGSKNVIEASIENNVESIVCLSTDKAVYPINTMGMSKALMEKIAFASARSQGMSDTRVCVTRYGNVLLSRGSIVPLVVKQIENHTPITLTNAKMTRFLMSLSDSVELVLHAFRYGNSGDLFVQKAPASTIMDLVQGILLSIGRESHPLKIIGTRHGEKLHESLLSSEERIKSTEVQKKFFRVPIDSRNLNYEMYFSQGNVESNPEAFSSNNTEMLDKNQVAELLLGIPEYQELIKDIR